MDFKCYAKDDTVPDKIKELMGNIGGLIYKSKFIPAPGDIILFVLERHYYLKVEQRFIGKDYIQLYLSYSEKW